jgi:hypothetical protein
MARKTCVSTRTILLRLENGGYRGWYFIEL